MQLEPILELSSATNNEGVVAANSQDQILFTDEDDEEEINFDGQKRQTLAQNISLVVEDLGNNY